MMLYHNNRLILPLLALGHAVNDLLAGYMLGCLVQTGEEMAKVAMGLFMYNLLAFGGQYAVAVLLERYGKHGSFLLLSYVLNVAALALFAFVPFLSMVLAGAGSAVYHVAGGSICIKTDKAATAGYFAAPGVAGLIAGGYMAYAGIAITHWLLLACGLFLLTLIKLRKCLVVQPAGKKDREAKADRPQLLPDRHDWIMILLLAVITMRSAIWNVFQLIHENNYYWLGMIALSAVVGKLAGGWLADKVGWRLYALWSLLAAMPLVTFFKNELLLFCIGIGLLQSGIPATTALLIRAADGSKEKGVALSFGTAIIFGAFVLYAPARRYLFSNAALWLLAALMAAILILLKKKRHNIQKLY